MGLISEVTGFIERITKDYIKNHEGPALNDLKAIIEQEGGTILGLLGFNQEEQSAIEKIVEGLYEFHLARKNKGDEGK